LHAIKCYFYTLSIGAKWPCRGVGGGVAALYRACCDRIESSLRWISGRSGLLCPSNGN